MEQESYDYHTFTKDTISRAVVQSRDRMLVETQNAGIAHLSYYLDADTRAYTALNRFVDTAPSAEYQAAKKELDNTTQFNLTTHLGERYNVGLSKYTYELKDGVLYPQDGSEPLLNMLIRGRDFRKQNGSSLYDQRREAAEIPGMFKSQAILAHPDTEIGTSVVSNSPRGEVSEKEKKAGIKTIYNHNFYDVFTLKEKDGKRFVEARRYSSALTRAEAAQKFAKLDVRYRTSETPSDEFFLSNPVVISPEKTADDIHAWLHEEHDFMSQEEFEKEILIPCMPILQFYLDTLTKNPYDTQTRNLAYNALLVKADTGAQRVKVRKLGIQHLTFFNDYYASDMLAVKEQVAFLGRQEAEQKSTGCGFSGGAEVASILGSAIGPFSVVEFGALVDLLGSRKFNCPECNHENIRPYNGYVENCVNCGTDKVACKEPQDDEHKKIVSLAEWKKGKKMKEGQEENIDA